MSEMTGPTACPQRVRALEWANRVRRARSALKAEIAAAQRSAAEIILTCPREAATMPIAQLLASQRGWGEVRSCALLAQVAVREDKPIGSLTERQRRAIASQLARANSRVQFDRGSHRL
jgi:hypothetical protein